jgi:phage tail protein X
LSSCVEAILAAQIGDVDKTLRCGMAALLMDLAVLVETCATAVISPRWAVPG